MFHIPQEITNYIAEFDQECWIKLYLYDMEFFKYATSDAGRRRFIELFTVCKQLSDRVQYYLFGKLNSVYDQPAIVSINHSIMIWYRNGLIHRDNDKPAYVCANGYNAWIQNGKIHRPNNKPARIWKNGHKEYWVDNQIPR
jgi:hypothetical protein